MPVFISPAQGHALRSMVNLIIPSDPQVPGALDMGVHEFIDAYWNECVPSSKEGLEDDYTKVADTDEQQFIKDVFANLETSFQADYGKELGKGSDEDFDALLAKYLRAPKEEQDANKGKMWKYMGDPTAELDSDAKNYYLLSTIRDLSFWAWKNSETIGETVLWYDPVPGQFNGCIPLSEAGNGKAMSL